VSSAGAVDLSVKIGALRLRNPILAASGTFGYGLEFAHLAGKTFGNEAAEAIQVHEVGKF